MTTTSIAAASGVGVDVGGGVGGGAGVGVGAAGAVGVGGGAGVGAYAGAQPMTKIARIANPDINRFVFIAFHLSSVRDPPKSSYHDIPYQDKE